MAADPATDIDQGDDIQSNIYAADQDDFEDRNAQSQLPTGLTPLPKPNFQQTAPGVYAPPTAPTPEPEVASALDKLRARRPVSYADIQNYVSIEAPHYSAPPPPTKEGKGDFSGDLVRYGAAQLDSLGQGAAGFGRFLNDQTANVPGIDEYLKGWETHFGNKIQKDYEELSPTRRAAAQANFLRTFNIGPDKDEQGNPIPSPFSNGVGGAGDYLAQRALVLGAPVAALYLAGAAGVGTLATIASGLIFGTTTLGDSYNKIADLVRSKPDAEYREEVPAYDALRSQGMPEREAQTHMLNGMWLSMLGSGVAGAIGGVGLGKFFGPGMSQLDSFLARRALGALEGGTAMGIQAGGANAGTQGGMIQTGLQKDFDTEALAREAAEGFGTGALAGGLLAGRKGAEPESKPGVGDAEQSALAAAGIYTTPAGPPEIAGPPAPPQGQLDLGTARPGSVAASPQGEMFPTVQEANRPTNAVGTGLTEGVAPPPPPGPVSSRAGGMPGARQQDLPINQTPPVIVPTTGQGELYPSLPEANPPRPSEPPSGAVPPAGAGGGQPPPSAPTPRSSGPGAGTRPSGTMKKTELNDALTTMGIDTKGMNRDDMARRFDREQARTPAASTETPGDTTVVTGSERPSPVSETSGQGVAETTAPPAPGDLTPSAASEGAPVTPEITPISELTAETSSGVRPEGGPPSVAAHAPTEATAEPIQRIIPEEAKARADAQDERVAQLAAARRAIPVKKGSPVEPLIQRAMAEMQEHITSGRGVSDADLMSLLQDYAARRETDKPGEQMARRGIAQQMAAQAKIKLKLGRIEPKAAVDQRSEVEQVHAEEQQRGAAEAREKATTGEAIEEKAAATEEGTALAEPVQRKVPKGTDTVANAKVIIDKLLDPSDPMDVKAAEAEYNKTSKSGRPRRKGYETLGDALQTELARVNKPGEEAKLRAQLEKNDAMPLHTREGTAARQLELDKRDTRSKELAKKLADFVPEHVKRIIDALRETKDEVGVAADKRAELAAKMAERSGKPLTQRATPSGISPSSSRYVRTYRDPRLNDFIHRAITASEEHGVPYTLHDALRSIVNHSGARVEMQPLWQLARSLLSRTRDIPVMSGEHALEQGYLQHPVEGAYGYYMPRAQGREHIGLGESVHPVETILHEALHSVTHDRFEYLMDHDPNHADLQAMGEILGELQRQFNAAGDVDPKLEDILISATEHIHEAHSWLMTNPDLQAFAASRAASPEFVARMRELGFAPRESGRSVWRYFTDLVRRALGLGTPASASDYTLLDHLLRPLTEITERAAQFNERMLPQDPVLRQRAEPLYQSIISSLGSRTREAIARTDPAGLGDKTRRGLLAATTSDAMVSRYRDILPGLDNWRAAYEGIARTGKVFSDKFSDRVRDLTRRYNGLDDQQTLGHLMTDATIAEAHLGDGLATDANAHLATSEQQAALKDLQQRYAKLSPEAKALYGEYRDTYNEWYKQQRTAELNALVRGFMPDATDAQREAFNRAAANKSALEKFLKDPDNSSIAASFGEDWTKNRALARGIAQVHSKGFVQGDYFPLRRFGDYVVRTGSAADPEHYSVEMFESRQKAEARRAELVRNGAEMVHQVADRRESDMRDLVPHHPAVDELVASLGKRGYTEGETKEVRDTLNSILLQHATHAEATKARMRRHGVRGAATDQARVLASEFVNSTARMGHLEYGLARSQALSDMRDQVTALERPDATPGHAITAASVLREAEKRSTAVDANNVWASLSAKANSFSFAQSLMSPSHMFTSTLEAHSNSMAFLGARHGIGRATLALTRALAQASPVLGKGVMNTLNAVRGELKASDWNLSHLVRDRMIAKGSNKAGLAQLFKALEDAGLIDHTIMQDLRRQANPTGAVRSIYGDVWNRFQAFSAASAHAVDVMNKSAIAKAAFDLEFQRTRDVNAAVNYAVETARKAMPNYNIGNKARVATTRGPLGALGAPLMQFKNYGLHEISILANLARESMSGPGRWEARKAFAGVLTSRAMMAGVITLIADPLRYIGGAYNLVTGAQKPHDYQNDVRRFMNDVLGPELGELVSRGLPHALGIDIHSRVGLANLLEIPEMNSFDAAGAGQVLLGLMTGVTGQNLVKDWDGLVKVLQGDVLGGAQTMLPRPVRDVMSAVDLAQKGVTTQRGRVLVPPSKIGAGAITARALGFQPSVASEAREGSAAIQERFQEAKDERTQLSNRWLQASPDQRQSIMQEIRRFNQDPTHHGMQLTVQQLLKDQQQRRQQAKAPFGLRLPKQAAKSLSQAGSFANAP